MLIYAVEHMDDGIAQLCSSFDKAIGWIKDNGEEWGGDDAQYTIVAQYLDGDCNEFESFGIFSAKGDSLTEKL